jgi:DNA helicase-2/ATP-dependent DNA helicase PcrA
MLKKLEPSDEQKAIIRDKGNVVVTAKPGSGKTFTVVEKIKCISEILLDYQGVIAISFTRKASHELAVRCERKNIPQKQSFYGTIDNFYISQIICPFAKHITRSNVKLEIRANLSEYPKYEALIGLKNRVKNDLEELLIEALKDGHIFLQICGETAMYILEKVKDCILYLKARYTHIFIDEYQDCGDAQHKVFMKLVDEGIIGVAVGDMDQAIYGFADRDSKYLAGLLSNDIFSHYEISKNHRCHKTISAYSLKMLGIRPQKLKEETRVIRVNVDGSDIEIMKAIDKYLPKIKKKYGIENNNEIAILCRNNGTAKRAYDFLSTPSKLFKETELDRYNSYWSRLFNDILQSYFDDSIYAIDFIEKYIDEDLSKKDFIKGINIINDIYYTDRNSIALKLDSFSEFASLVYPEYRNDESIQVLKKILLDEEQLLSYKPADENEVCILTLHKSKGLEYKVVFHLDLYKWIFPWEDISDEDYIQSLNLHYVGVTRAIEVCYLMQGTRRFRSKQKDYIEAVESPFLNIEGLKALRRATSWDV